MGKASEPGVRWWRKPSETTMDAVPCSPLLLHPGEYGTLLPLSRMENFRDHSMPKNEGQGNWGACPSNKKYIRGIWVVGPERLMGSRSTLFICLKYYIKKKCPAWPCRGGTGGQGWPLLGAQVPEWDLISESFSRPSPAAPYGQISRPSLLSAISQSPWGLSPSHKVWLQL